MNQSNKITTMNRPPIEVLKSEGILQDENYETIYMTEEETNKFMEKYMAENPEVEIETRYVKPIEPWLMKQEIQVTWLVPDEPVEGQNPKQVRSKKSAKKL